MLDMNITTRIFISIIATITGIFIGYMIYDTYKFKQAHKQEPYTNIEGPTSLSSCLFGDENDN